MMYMCRTHFQLMILNDGIPHSWRRIAYSGNRILCILELPDYLFLGLQGHAIPKRGRGPGFLAFLDLPFWQIEELEAAPFALLRWASHPCPPTPVDGTQRGGEEHEARHVSYHARSVKSPAKGGP